MCHQHIEALENHQCAGEPEANAEDHFFVLNSEDSTVYQQQEQIARVKGGHLV